MAFAFSRLYNEFAWAYDKISYLVSRGEWHRWQLAALPRLRGPRILDIGFGTGDLLSEMRNQGYLCYGVELSPSMLRMAKRKGVKVPLCQARAQDMPFRDGVFDSLVSTFPSSFILDPRAQREMARLLAPGGRLVVVDEGRLLGRDPCSRFLNWAREITSGDGSLVQLCEVLLGTGLELQVEEERSERSRVGVIVGTKVKEEKEDGTG
ncbi:MAG: methyltransferase domain-containing protein [Anaerolineae bacterium]|nr:methyltransferase domain-containing protein [Anaerolineae bacterium]